MGGQVDAAQLQEWLRAEEERIGRLEDQLGPLQAELRRSQERLALLRRLVAIADGTGPAPEAPEPPTFAGLEGVPEDAPIGDVVAAILARAGQPLHIRDIRERFLAGGRKVPGRGTDSNLLVYVVRDPRFERVSKGTYVLVDTQNHAPPDPGRRPRRRRRRTRQA